MNREPLPYTLAQIGRYEIQAQLGRGGMGVVYRAYEAALERTVALKILNPELAEQPALAERLRREAISAARLRHPNIALLYEFGQADETMFLAMEYVPGRSLHQLLEDGPLTPQRALSILRQIGQALDYAHAMGIVHRDVKPSNIIVGSDDHAVLIDFGLAEISDESLLTTDGAILGTPHYMAPEQAEGRGADARSDQYGLAAVAYELLAGVPPFHGRSVTTAIIYAHVHDLPPPPTERQPTLPPAVNPVILRALSKAPHERYPSLMAFVSDLAAALATPAPPRPRSRQWLWLFGSLALLLAVIAALGGGTLLWNTSSPQQPAADLAAPGTPRIGVPLPQQVIWSYNVRSISRASLALQDDTLVGDTLAGSLLAVRADNGAVRWQKDRVGARATIFGAPSVGAGLVFVGTIDGEVFGFSLNTGGLVWRRSVKGAVQRAPVLVNDRLIVTTTKGYVYVLQASSGQVVWGRPLELGLEDPGAGAGQVFVSAGRLLSAIDMSSGTVNWEFEADSDLTTRPVIFGGLVLVGTERGVLHALRTGDGQEQWQSRINGALHAAPAVGADALFVVDHAGGVTAISADGATVLWQFVSGSAIDATPILADGKLLFGASNGTFYVLDAQSGRQLARMQLGGSVDSSPALGNGLIFVRADRIYALGS